MKSSIIIGLLAVLSVAAVGAVSGTPVFAEDDDYDKKLKCKIKFKDKDHDKDYEDYDDDWKKVILKCKKKD
jgi:hypothetical protein